MAGRGRAPSTFQPKLRLAPRSRPSMPGCACTAPCSALCSRMNSSSVGTGMGLFWQHTIRSAHAFCVMQSRLRCTAGGMEWSAHSQTPSGTTGPLPSHRTETLVDLLR